ncbi:uncharacterized protein LOC129892559 [Solanum dulcamara]|uniref:uncharacterized protein LOC129892559 n=1 Tax=Solanum dulcamara TaxID=45834 RepID=UPI0024859B9F|nr:uncharacterized protein LOC129892559 [Solanum dulcamara]
MILDVAGPNFGQGSSSKYYNNIEPELPYSYEPSIEEDTNPSMEEAPGPSMEEEPNPESQRMETAGKLACPYCMEETQSFRLQHGMKTSWFDCHRMFLDQHYPFRRDSKNFFKGKTVKRLPLPYKIGQEILNQICDLGIGKVIESDAEEVNRRICKSCGWKKRSIFWDLPYWSSNMIRHNLDVMHIEKNVFDNIFNTVMVNYCDRPQLAKDTNGKYSKAVYTIDKEERAILFNWVKELKFPDGNVWQALTELSLFFKDLTSTTLQVDDMKRLETDIAQILCKLERIFPPGFFNSMEHLPVHLPYEARIAGPVQYRWMYPFERYLGTLKRMIGNKASVEGSICEAYLMTESTQLFSHYFEPHVRSNHIENEFLRSLAHGTLIGATCHSMYFVNGYKFHTECHGSARSTMNSGVCISDPNFGDYYGWIKEIIQVEYREKPLKQIVLFKCDWFDPTMDVGVKKDIQYKLVDINHRRRYKKYEPFILAMQATQVCYMPYPSKKKDRIDWAAVLKVKPRNIVELPDEEVATTSELNVPFQVEEVEVHEINVDVSIDENVLLHDLNGDVIK